MGILLRDRNPKLVAAWRRTFGVVESYIQVSEGDIFDLRADAIVSPANSFGFMDGGIDLVYAEFFGPELPRNLRSAIKAEHCGELPVGQAVVVETGNEEIPFMVSAPTMRVPQDVSRTVNAYLAFRAALLAVVAHNASEEKKIGSILCPGLGTAVGRMGPDTCAKQMLLAVEAVLDGVEAPRSLHDAVSIHRWMTL